MIRLLLVDDDNDFCFIIKNELENIIGDYHVITAQNGKEGLKKWREYNPDVIVSDIKMPLLNGLDMIKSIRQVDTEIPILIITGLAQEQKVEEGYIHGANIFIRKSFDIYDLDGHIKGIYKSSFFWSHKTKKELYNIGDYTLFTRSGIILNNVSNKSANLTETENEILCMLAEDMEHIVSKNCITKPSLEIL